MMFPCSALPPPLYPAFLRPPVALSSPLNRSLHSGLLVEDLLRWSQPVSYIQRTFSSRSPGDILQLSAGQCGPPRLRGPGTERCVPPAGSPQSGGPEPGYLKFGVSAILAPSTRSVQSVQKSFPLPFFDGSLHPFIRASYFT
ncbi:homeobox protein DBX1-B-like, partial [Notothenia coriiceps]|uniref:Homeobox protein DBX1-B-like n=1 Tax=Notothenia coriiceps TaxID=8208 RepID=A0A6I9NYH6_9TELE